MKVEIKTSTQTLAISITACISIKKLNVSFEVINYTFQVFFLAIIKKTIIPLFSWFNLSFTETERLSTSYKISSIAYQN